MEYLPMLDGFVQLSIRIPPYMRIWLHKEADKDMSNISIIVRRAIKLLIDQKESEAINAK